MGCVAPASRSVIKSIERPKPDFSDAEQCNEKCWDSILSEAQENNVPPLYVAAWYCNVKAVKRALMSPDGIDALNQFDPFHAAYPIHFAAGHPMTNNSVEVIRILIQHGACPNVIRGDGKHLLEICQETALRLDRKVSISKFKWMPVKEGKTEEDLTLRVFLGKGEHLDDEERKESEELVEMVIHAMNQHKLCPYCKFYRPCWGWCAWW
jgi:ankyrin repeat protein